jgi:hypothetical protein
LIPSRGTLGLVPKQATFSSSVINERILLTLSSWEERGCLRKDIGNVDPTALCLASLDGVTNAADAENRQQQ